MAEELKNLYAFCLMHVFHLIMTYYVQASICLYVCVLGCTLVCSLATVVNDRQILVFWLKHEQDREIVEYVCHFLGCGHIDNDKV